MIAETVETFKSAASPTSDFSAFSFCYARCALSPFPLLKLKYKQKGKDYKCGYESSQRQVDLRDYNIARYDIRKESHESDYHKRA